MSRPGSAPRPRPSRAGAPVVLRVVSERVPPEEAARSAAPGATATLDPAGRSGAAGPVATVADTRPTLAPRLPARRGPWGRLADLVTGRRRTGRHRPDTLHSHGWSMFAPQRRGRRWGVRAH